MLGRIDVTLGRRRLDADKREVLAAIDAVAARGRRSPLAARTVGYVLAQGFSLPGQLVVRAASGDYTRGRVRDRIKIVNRKYQIANSKFSISDFRFDIFYCLPLDASP